MDIIGEWGAPLINKNCGVHQKQNMRSFFHIIGRKGLTWEEPVDVQTKVLRLDKGDQFEGKSQQ